MMQGKRVYPNEQGELYFQPGDYGLDPRDGKWKCRPPGKDGLLGSLGAHEVVEHEDGTITVSPSILIEHWDGKTWHGFLERGIWREV